jgi:hypothetical protein
MSLQVRQPAAALPLIIGTAAGFSLAAMTIISAAPKRLTYGTACDRPMHAQPAYSTSGVWRARRAWSRTR